MPTLPSGKVLMLSRDTIVANDGTLFRCPDGYFWYQTPDLAFNTPPFQEGQSLTMDLAHAPVPATREEAKNGPRGGRGSGRRTRCVFSTKRSSSAAARRRSTAPTPPPWRSSLSCPSLRSRASLPRPSVPS
jgi:hypothetical protein